MHRLSRRTVLRALLLFVFTLSGAAGLVYEVLWSRRLTHVFGSTTLAVSTVLAAFMGGLAAGSYAFGSWADRRPRRALAAYGLLELGVGAFGLAVPLLLRAVEAVYLALAPVTERSPFLFFAAQFVLVAAVLAPPCALMGGTLPLLVRWLVGREEEIGAGVGTLYAANTFGAAVGTAAAAYVLLPYLGVRPGELCAVAVNVAAGLAALAIARGKGEGGRMETEEPQALDSSPPANASRGPSSAPLLAAVALSGFAAMADEVAWARVFGLVFGSSVYAFGLMLLEFLVGIAIGSAIFSRLRRRDPGHVLGVALVANTAVALLGLLAVPHLPTGYMRGFPLILGSFAAQQALELVLTAPVLLPLAMLFGIAFPAAVAATADRPGMGRGVGRVTAWNTAGTVCGAFLAGFVLIPGIGLRATLVVAAAATAIGGGIALRASATGALRRVGLAAAASALVVAMLLPGWPRELLAQGAGFYAAFFGSVDILLESARTSELLFYRDGIATTLSVDQQNGQRFYRSNGKTDASTAPGDMANQLLLGHLPMLIHPSPRDVFVLGLGTGVSAAAIARYPVRSIEIADIEASARDATRLFAAENRDILSDPRVRLIVADGRNALLARRADYDVIVSDPSDVWVAGVGSLFTREFYALARSRLRPGGVMVQWFHMHSLPPEDMKLIVATFRSVFPHTSFWRPNRGDVILVGTVEPTPWDYARLSERVATVPGVSQDLVGIGFWSPLSVFAAFVLDGADLDRMLAGVRSVHTDDHPVIEYLTPRAGYTDTTTVNDAGIQALQTKAYPDIAGFDEKRDLDARGLYLLGFGYASIGRTDPAIRLMEQSVQLPGAEAKFWVGLGNQYRLRGQTARAGAAYERALAMNPADSEASIQLAELARAQGDDALAERVLAAALSRSRDDAAVAEAAARLLNDAGRPKEASAALAAALERAPGNASLQLLSGRALAASGQGEPAKAALRRAAEAAGTNAALLRDCGDAMLAAGDVAGASSAFESATRIEPRNGAAFAGLAKAARARGDTAAAREARRRALELDPYNPDALEMPE
ncbi:MAG TPA: fused MFS/spermidine synthase [Thermoanaerobaculia bacterium]|jgi:spermidine synthase|nr:fused MFS/spermidine synthase [Thermoanaerobaculia bacterium]